MVKRNFATDRKVIAAKCLRAIPYVATLFLSIMPLFAAGCGSGSVVAVDLLKSSYVPPRKLGRDRNENFRAEWRSETGQEITIRQSMRAAPIKRDQLSRAWRPTLPLSPCTAT